MPLDLCSLRKSYHETFCFDLLQTDASGRILVGQAEALDCACSGLSDRRRLQAAEQTRYWGETIINLCCDSGYAMWAVPILDNNELTGALVVQGVKLEDQPEGFHESVQRAAETLLEWALEANCLSRAEVENARRRAHRENERFLAIESSKLDPLSDDMRSIYLNEEPALLSAIKQGAIKEARAILNRVLIGIYGLAGERMELLKSSILELVVMMNRAAVEAGADPATVLGRNYRSLTELAAIDDEEELSDWLRRMLETLIECIQINDTYPNSVLLSKAVRYMEANLHQHIRRDQVARVAGLSPSHFSKLVSENLGLPFGQLLTQMRVNRAKELLLRSSRPLSAIAIDCGFFDQSHFNKTFRAATSHAPGEYRKRGQ